jgi:DNA-directed RNA polymerase subunit H (RpoH/RPB5)
MELLVGHSPQYIVYQNIIKCIEYSHQKLLHGSVKFGRDAVAHTAPLTKEQFLKIFQSQHYVVLEAEDHNRHRGSRPSQYRTVNPPPTWKIKTYYLLVDPDEVQNFANTPGQLVEAINKLGIPSQRRKDHDRELVIIVRDANDTYINNTVAALQFPAMLQNGAPEGGLHALFNSYEYFTGCPRPEHVSVPKHHLLTIEEEIKVTQELKIQKHQMAKLRRNECMVVWLGAEPDQIVAIQKSDDTVLSRPEYRVVI